MIEAPRACEAPTASGNRCIRQSMMVVDGLHVCPIHSGDDEIKREDMKALSAKAVAARAAKKDSSNDELLKACEFSTPESIGIYLSAMARAAIERNDPRFLGGAAKIAERSQTWLELLAYKEEALHYRKMNGIKAPSPRAGHSER